MTDDLFREADKFAMGSVEEEFAQELAERARTLGLTSTAMIEIDASDAPELGDETINLDRVRALADAKLAEAAE